MDKSYELFLDHNIEITWILEKSSFFKDLMAFYRRDLFPICAVTRDSKPSIQKALKPGIPSG